MNILADVLLISGALTLSFGAYMAWPPLGAIVLGSLLLAGGLKAIR